MVARPLRAAACGPALFGITAALRSPPWLDRGSGLGPDAPADAAGSSAASPSFDDFVERFGREYQPGSAEHEERRSLFERRLAEIAAINSAAGPRLWKAGVNYFADRTEEELARLRGRRGRAATASRPAVSLLATGSSQAPANCTLPAAVTWQHLSAMRDIRDQDSCGSCWAVATATMLRAHVNIHLNQDPVFSVQQLIDCVPNPQRCGGGGGCSGATSELAMDYVMHNGLVMEAQLPYRGSEYACPASMAARNPSPTPMPASGSLLSTMVEARTLGIASWQKLPENRMFPLMRALYEAGPVAVSVAANSMWNHYDSGILNACPRDAVVNHLVVLVAYGASHSGEKYWTLQNSWGRGWGEAGFIRLLLTDDEETAQCGWDHEPEVGTACDGGPSQVRVCGHCGILYDSVVPTFANSGAAALNLQQEACQA